MPKAAPQQDDRPVTPEEQAESKLIARRHFSAFRAELRRAGIFIQRPRRRNKRKRAPKPEIANPTEADATIAIASIAQGLMFACRRGDCRRAFACRFGDRRRDTSYSPPCLDRLPRDGVIALRLGVMRSVKPEAFRERSLAALETGLFRRLDAVEQEKLDAERVQAAGGNNAPAARRK